jgi:integrase
MASVFKRPGSRYWYAAYRTPLVDGAGNRHWKLERKVTKHTDRSKAQKAADVLEDDALKENGAGEDGSKRILGILRRAAELAMQKRLTVDEGRLLLAEIVREATGEALKVWTIKGWLNEWIALKTPTTKRATVTRYQHSVDSLLEFLGEKAELPLEHLSVQNLRSFREMLHKGGRTAKTCNGYIKDLKASLSAAVKEGLLRRMPAGTLKDLPEEDGMERETFTPKEMLALVVAAPTNDWKGVILLGAFGGLRLGDAAKLRLSNLSLAEGTVSYIPEKSSRRGKKAKVLLPMHKELQKHFTTTLPDANSEEYCFPSLCRTSVSGNRGLSAKFVEIMEKAGVSRGKVKERIAGQAGRSSHSKSFHSLRHTFNSAMLNKGVAQELRMKIVGHSDTESNDGYSHAEIQSLRAAVDLVPGFDSK